MLTSKIHGLSNAFGYLKIKLYKKFASSGTHHIFNFLFIFNCSIDTAICQLSILRYRDQFVKLKYIFEGYSVLFLFVDLSGKFARS